MERIGRKPDSDTARAWSKFKTGMSEVEMVGTLRFSPPYSFTPHIVTDLSPYRLIALSPFWVETLSLSPPSPFTLHHIHLTHCKNYQHLISLVHPRIKRHRSQSQRKLNVSVGVCSHFASLMPLLGLLIVKI